MKKRLHVLFILIGIGIFSSCKTEFEKVRTSGDPKLLLEKADEYFEEGEFQKAQTLYELIIPVYRGQAELEDIYYNYAYTYYNLGSYILAAYYFDNFGQTFGASPRREEIDFMAAYANYKLSPSFRLDQKYTLQAIDKLQNFINTYTSSEKVDQANDLIIELRDKLEEKAFDSGKLYYEVRQYASAVQALDNLLKDFPETKRLEEVKYYIILAAFEYAENSIIDKQEERYKDVLKRTEAFISKHSESSYINEVRTISKKTEIKLENIEKDDRYKVKSPVYRS